MIVRRKRAKSSRNPHPQTGCRQGLVEILHNTDGARVKGNKYKNTTFGKLKKHFLFNIFFGRYTNTKLVVLSCQSIWIIKIDKNLQ